MRDCFSWRAAFVGMMFLCLVPVCAALAGTGPTELAGLRLGQSVDACAGKLMPKSVDRALYRPYLGIMPAAPVQGYRSGYVEFGLCAAPGRIVRIKMHYADDSLEFYNRVLAALKKRYGEPREWRGNAFGTLRTWKWGLTAPDGEPVSLILMHYEGTDGAFTEGNSIRIAATGRVAQEQRCHEARDRDAGSRDDAPSVKADIQSLGLEWFLPR